MKKILTIITLAAASSLHADDAAVIYYIQKQTKAIERQTRVIQGDYSQETNRGRGSDRRGVNSYDQQRLATDPWGPNGQFANRPQLSKEEILKTQGNTAQAQWARIRASK